MTSIKIHDVNKVMVETVALGNNTYTTLTIHGRDGSVDELTMFHEDSDQLDLVEEASIVDMRSVNND